MSKTNAILAAMRETGLDNAPAIADFLGFQRDHVSSLMSKLGDQQRIVRVGQNVTPGSGFCNPSRRTWRWAINPEKEPRDLSVRPPARRVPFAGADGVGRPRSWR